MFWGGLAILPEDVYEDGNDTNRLLHCGLGLTRMWVTRILEGYDLVIYISQQ